MSKKRVAPKAQALQTIPLSAISITWPARDYYEGDAKKPAVTITGAALGALCGFLARLRGGNVPNLLDEDADYLELTGLTEVLRAVALADTSSVDMGALHSFLADSLDVVAAHLAVQSSPNEFKKATVTIHGAAPKAEAEEAA